MRHTAVDVEPGVCYGSSDVGLRPSFPAEAAAVAERLGDTRFQAVYTSPLSRARRLARACGYADAVADSRLAEMDFGEWEMKRWDEITDPRLQEWYADFVNVVPTGGESFMQQQARVRSFLRQAAVAHRGGRIAAFCHGGVMMQAMLIAGTATMENIFDLQPPYGGVVEISFATHPADISDRV